MRGKIEIVEGGMTALHVHAVVDAANGALAPGGGRAASPPD